MRDFGLSIDPKMVTVSGRILPPPLLQYGGKVGYSAMHYMYNVHQQLQIRVLKLYKCVNDS